MPGLSSAIATNSPIANENSTVNAAKPTVQARTRRNGREISGSWTTRPKLCVPTPVFQPGSSSSLPLAATNEPLPLSRNTVPSESRVNVLAFGSYFSVGSSTAACVNPWGWIASAPFPVGMLNPWIEKSSFCGTSV